MRMHIEQNLICINIWDHKPNRNGPQIHRRFAFTLSMLTTLIFQADLLIPLHTQSSKQLQHKRESQKILQYSFKNKAISLWRNKVASQKLMWA